MDIIIYFWWIPVLLNIHLNNEIDVPAVGIVSFWARLTLLCFLYNVASSIIYFEPVFNSDISLFSGFCRFQYYVFRYSGSHPGCLYCFVLSSASDVVTVSFGVSLYSVSTLLDFASVISIYVCSIKCAGIK